jgi:hypothetical protein
MIINTDIDRVNCRVEKIAGLWQCADRGPYSRGLERKRSEFDGGWSSVRA